MHDEIRFNVPAIEGNEIAYVSDSVRRGHTASGGDFSRRASSLLSEAHSDAEVFLTTSCTAALEMSAMLLDAKPGDTVIVPSFTFVTTALAYAREGLKVVFADIEPKTLGINPSHVASLIDETTRAVIAVHYGGIGCDLDGLEGVLAAHPGVHLIEDNAHGLFGKFRGRPLGTFGRFSTLSFHETKNFFCGEGGALIANRSDDVDRARIIYEKGTNRRAFMLGEVERYTWVDKGSSFALADLNAAFLFGQLEKRQLIMDKRRSVFNEYLRNIAPHVVKFDLTLPEIGLDRSSGYHNFYVLLPDRTTRNRALSGMKERGIHPTFHYVPLHSSIGGKRFRARPTDCPITDDISGRLLRLPFHNNLSSGEIARVVDCLVKSIS